MKTFKTDKMTERNMRVETSLMDRHKNDQCNLKFGTIFTCFACKMSQNVLPNTYAVDVAVEAAKTSLRLN